MTSSLPIAAAPFSSSTACSRPTPPVTHAAAPDAPRVKREVRVTGIVEAVHSSKVLVPQIFSQGGPMTLTKLIPNGSKVKEGDLIAVFDAPSRSIRPATPKPNSTTSATRSNKSAAQNRADAEKRVSDLRQAEADLAKAKSNCKRVPYSAKSTASKRMSGWKPPAPRRQPDQIQRRPRQERCRLPPHPGTPARSPESHARTHQIQHGQTRTARPARRHGRPPESLSQQLHGPCPGRRSALPRPADRQHFRSHRQCSSAAPSASPMVPPSSPAARPPCTSTLIRNWPSPLISNSPAPLPAPLSAVPSRAFTAVFKLDKSDPHLMPDLSAAVVVDAPTQGDGRENERRCHPST